MRSATSFSAWAGSGGTLPSRSSRLVRQADDLAVPAARLEHRPQRIEESPDVRHLVPTDQLVPGDLQVAQIGVQLFQGALGGRHRAGHWFCRSARVDVELGVGAPGAGAPGRAPRRGARRRTRGSCRAWSGAARAHRPSGAPGSCRRATRGARRRQREPAPSTDATDVLDGFDPRRREDGKNAKTSGARPRRAARSSTRWCRAGCAAARGGRVRHRAGRPAGRRVARCSSSTEKMRNRAVASSIASGRPSSRVQTSATARAFASLSTKSGAACCARSTNSRTASYWITCSAVIERAARFGNGERLNREESFAADAQRLAAGDDHFAARRTVRPARRRRPPLPLPARSCPGRAARGGHASSFGQRTLHVGCHRRSLAPIATAIVRSAASSSRAGARSTKYTPSGKKSM